VDGVELDVKELLIYIITHYGLETKARAKGCEISITFDGAKLDDYCCHIIRGFKLTDNYLKDPLSGRLLFDTMQSKRNCIPIVSIIAKDNKAAYDRFLTHIFEFGNELRTVGIPELGYKKFRVAEPQDMKISQLCMSRGGAAKQIPHFCHVCQKHIEDIARPNQMACATCALTPGKLCYCYPLMDTAIIVSLTAKQDMLDMNLEAHRLTFMCEQFYNGY
jgi:hypothetical protein